MTQFQALRNSSSNSQPCCCIILITLSGSLDELLPVANLAAWRCAFFFLSWWINWCWQRSHYNWNLVNPVLVIPLLCMYDFWCFVDRFSCFSLKNPTDRVALAAFELIIRSSHDRSLLPVIIIQRYLPWDVIQDVLHGHVGGTCSTCTSW